MSRISAHDTAIYVDSENTTLDKVLKKVADKVTEIDEKVENINTDGTLIATKTKLGSLPELGTFTDKGLKCAIVLDKTVNANTKLILHTANNYFLNPINFVSGYTWLDNLLIANGCAIYKDLRDDKIYIVVRQLDIG